MNPQKRSDFTKGIAYAPLIDNLISYDEFTVADAISLRSRLRGGGSYDGDADFESALQNKMEYEYSKRVEFADTKNKQLQSTAENMRLSILGKDSKVKDEKPLEVVDAYVRENTAELIDPLDIQKNLEKAQGKEGHASLRA